MSFIRHTNQHDEAPFRGDGIERSCELAYEYFSTLLDNFISRLPEHRLQQDFRDWMADGHTLPEKIILIFPSGFGEYNEGKNLNPIVWPVLMDLSDAVRDGTTNAFARELCDLWGKTFNADGRFKERIELLHHIFDYLANYLQMFTAYADVESLCPDFSPDKDFDHWWSEINQRIAERYYG